MLLFLATWILLTHITVLQCQDAVCKTSVVGTAAHPHQGGVFSTRAACEEQRAFLEAAKLPVVSSSSRPGLTIRQQLTAVCKEGG